MKRFVAALFAARRTSFPALDALQTRYAKQGLKVLGLTLEANDDAIIGDPRPEEDYVSPGSASG